MRINKIKIALLGIALLTLSTLNSSAWYLRLAKHDGTGGYKAVSHDVSGGNTTIMCAGDDILICPTSVSGTGSDDLAAVNYALTEINNNNLSGVVIMPYTGKVVTWYSSSDSTYISAATSSETLP